MWNILVRRIAVRRVRVGNIRVSAIRVGTICVGYVRMLLVTVSDIRVIIRMRGVRVAIHMRRVAVRNVLVANIRVCSLRVWSVRMRDVRMFLVAECCVIVPVYMCTVRVLQWWVRRVIEVGHVAVSRISMTVCVRRIAVSDVGVPRVQVGNI